MKQRKFVNTKQFSSAQKRNSFLTFDLSHVELSPELAIETGIHVGDGSMNIYNNRSLYTVACHHIDDKIFMDDVVLPLIYGLYGKTPKPRLWSKGAYGFRICSKELIQFKHQILGLPLGKKTKIEIPQQILQEKKLFVNFLKGFFATDGCLYLWFTNNKYYPRLQMYNISQQLILQIKEGLEKMSFKVTYWNSNTNEKWNIMHKLSINGITMLHKWASEIGFINQKHQIKYKKFVS